MIEDLKEAETLLITTVVTSIGSKGQLEIMLDYILKAHIHDSEHSTFMFKIPFDQFNNLTCINKGGFSAIYKATWKYDHESEIDVVLKVIEDTKNMESAFLNEVNN
ncbi:251_t:CDS:2 [Gigaspora margarita]|uniref:251_t:CDS:1 n=1 Tax=Gigaspora margarita TaxID=4874 RepID=A0ABM8W110_GIGMA|nr:251_t:CDS:2 [Gigaspora margarita]